MFSHQRDVSHDFHDISESLKPHLVTNFKMRLSKEGYLEIGICNDRLMENLLKGRGIIHVFFPDSSVGKESA